LTMHQLRPANRIVAYVFPTLVLAMVAYSVPGFMETGRVIWLGYIFALPLLLSIVICREYRAAAIGFDTKGVKFRSVGYTLDVPWADVTLKASESKPMLRVTGGNRIFFPWFGLLHGLVTQITPYRARRADAMMTIIPLYAFLKDGDDPVMRDLYAAAPKGWT
jgi:hypothetical protein